jgi:hypothetical protein
MSRWRKLLACGLSQKQAGSLFYIRCCTLSGQRRKRAIAPSEASNRFTISSGAKKPTLHTLALAGDMIPTPTVGQPPAPPTRPKADRIPTECGRTATAKWSSGADLMTPILLPAADTALLHRVRHPRQRLLRPRPRQLRRRQLQHQRRLRRLRQPRPRRQRFLRG